MVIVEVEAIVRTRAWAVAGVDVDVVFGAVSGVLKGIRRVEVTADLTDESSQLMSLSLGIEGFRHRKQVSES